MRRAILFFAFALATSAFALPQNVEKIDSFRGIDQYRLRSNGMTILLAPDHTSPVFTFMVVYHVGSRNEAPGNTGSAHLLEHMIFNKSTENFGKAKGHKTFQEVLYEAGADFASTNMTTWYDRMNGYSTLPADKLELAMRIEADRLSRGLILDSERQSEMSVVRNEYEIGENNPGRRSDKAIIASAIQAHPYHWSTIGYRSDIEGVTTEKLREHYQTFFHPDNAEAMLVGDFDTEQALALFDREFGSFPKSSKPIPEVITVEPPQEGERRAIVQRPGTVGMVMLGYMRPGALASRLHPPRGAQLHPRRRRQLPPLPGARRAGPRHQRAGQQLHAAATPTRSSSTPPSRRARPTRKSRRRSKPRSRSSRKKASPRKNCSARSSRSRSPSSAAATARTTSPRTWARPSRRRTGSGSSPTSTTSKPSPPRT